MSARGACVLAGFLVAVCSASCAGPGGGDGPGCLQSEPDRLGDACGGDGECGEWLVCVARRCELPPAVAGAGGERLAIETDGEITAELDVEIARSDLARRRGLNHRPCIETGWGLLIEFPTSGDHLITTNEMRFDLDVAMAGEDRVVHTVHYDAPAGGKALLGGNAPVRVVVETSAGETEVTVGDVARPPR